MHPTKQIDTRGHFEVVEIYKTKNGAKECGSNTLTRKPQFSMKQWRHEDNSWHLGFKAQFIKINKGS